MPAAAPKLTAANAMQGATLPTSPHCPVSSAPPHPPVVRTPAPEVVEHPTAPHRPVVARPAPIQPSFQELPQVMPSHLVVTQPGTPNPYPAQRRNPVAATQATDEGPSPLVTPPDSGEVPALERAAAPSQPAQSVSEAVDVLAAPASLWRRTCAWLLDLAVIAVVVAAFFGAALAVIGRPSPSLLLSVAVPALGVVGFVAFVYTTLFAFLWHGRTPGRRVLGIHLVDASGHAPRAGRALVRAALSLASFGLFLSGFWLALFDRRGQTLHDKLTSTFVVQLKPAV
jgi:resuscitation-promoting factor RpfA